MNNMDIMSIILTVGTGLLGVAVTFVQYIISRRSETKEIEIKYNIRNTNSSLHEDLKDGNSNDNADSSDIKDDYVHTLLESYHNQAIQQANIQFWFSIIASIVGFAFIFMIIFLEENNVWYEYILKTFPGVIVELISALFISQAKETRERATNLFEELNYDNKIDKSVDIADTIENNDVKSEVKAKIALHIIGIKNDNNDK